MTIFNHEMKRSRKTLIIGSTIAGAMIFICMLLYPQMKDSMGNINEMFANMGDFTAAFGMDKINYGTAMGFYGVECGSMICIGGAMFGALLGINILAKEENNHTAEFLLANPISRCRVITEKLLSLFIQVLCFDLICVICALISFGVIGEAILWNNFWLFHLAQFVMHFEIACICFGISAFLKHGGVGVGIGIATLLYFLNIYVNISKNAEFLKYITPFHYSDASEIFYSGKIDGGLLGIGVIIAVVFVITAYIKYMRKDITA